MDEITINNAYQKLTEARDGLFKASDAVSGAREELEGRKIEVFKAGKIDGKNETDRKAQYAEQCMAENEKVDRAENALRLAQLEYDKASYEVNRIKTLLDWLALENG
jgi:multidrug resistance efflux pump